MPAATGAATPPRGCLCRPGTRSAFGSAETSPDNNADKVSIHRISPWTARPNCLTFGIKRSYCPEVVTVLRLQTARGGTVDLWAPRPLRIQLETSFWHFCWAVNKNKPTVTKAPFVLRHHLLSPGLCCPSASPDQDVHHPSVVVGTLGDRWFKQ